MKRTKRTKVFSILLMLMMVLALVPAVAFADVAIEEGAGSVTQSAYGVSAGDVVYFGSYPQSELGEVDVDPVPPGIEGVDYIIAPHVGKLHPYYFKIEPIAWHVLSNDGTRLFLLAQNALDIKNYDTPPTKNVTWETSALRSWLNGYTLNESGASIANPYTDNFLDRAFSVEEQAAIVTTDVPNLDNPVYGTDGGNGTQDKVFSLSIAEVTDTGYGFTNNNNSTATRVATITTYATAKSPMLQDWSLRSPGDAPDRAASVNRGGVVDSDGNSAAPISLYVRPAFNLNLSSVLFTSAAAGGKSTATVGANLSTTTVPTGSIKFTIEDTSAAPGFTASATARSGDTYTITYANAATDAKNSISAIVMRGSVMTHYGQLVHPASASGTTTVALPTGFDLATDTLQVFEEELNGDNYTDFATTPITIDTTAPTLSNVNFVERTSDTVGKITATSNEAGAVYYKAVADNASVTQPTAAADLSSWTSVGAITASTATQYDITLAAGAQDVYVVAVDAAGNISLQSKVDFAAYTAPPYTVLKHFDDFTGSGISSARVDADHSKFNRLLKDGKEIDRAHYAITQGSTIITFTETHLKTLANGTHWYVAEFTDGTSENISLEVNVVVASTTGVPQTGDNSNIAVLWVALICGALGMLCLAVWRRRQRATIGK